MRVYANKWSGRELYPSNDDPFRVFIYQAGLDLESGEQKSCMRDVIVKPIPRTASPTIAPSRPRKPSGDSGRGAREGTLKTATKSRQVGYRETSVIGISK